MKGDFGELLKHYRNGQAVPQNELAGHLGMKPPNLNAVESGARGPLNKERILRAAEYLNLELSDTILLLAAAAREKRIVQNWGNFHQRAPLDDVLSQLTEAQAATVEQALRL